MYTTKRILAFIISIILVLCSVAVIFAEETIGVSISADDESLENSVTCKKNKTFDLYFGADKFSLGDKKLNTYKFTIWFDEDYLKLDDDIENKTSAEGYPITEEVSEKEIDETTYKGVAFTFASFDKGFEEATEEFNALAKIPFKATKVGSTSVLITAEDVSLLPVVTKDNLKDTLVSSVIGDKVEITIKKASDDDGGSFFPGGVSAVKRTVIFNVDGTKTSVVLADGKKVTKPADPAKEGYTFLGWYDKKTGELFNFNAEIVESVELIAKFAKHDAEVSALPFTDVKENDWFYAGVKYVWEQSMVKGISETLYAPDNSLTRATLVTLLYRMENEPSAPQNIFADVASGSWYENAVAWAAEKEIVLGIGEGMFAPDTDITREQIAVILYKYTKFKGGDVSKTADLNGFTDAADISDWAKDALSWAVAENLIQGMGDGSVAPSATANRAQIATILMRYMQ